MAALFLTGVVWLVFEHYVRLETDFGPSRWARQATILQLHGWLSAFAIFLLGSVTAIHVIPQFNRGKKLKSGGPLFLITVFLSLSGIALYYISHEDFRRFVAIAHWAIGLSIPTLIATHVIKGARP